MPIRRSAVSRKDTLGLLGVQRRVDISHAQSLREISRIAGIDPSKIPAPKVVSSLPTRGGRRKSGESETGQNVGGKAGKVQTFLKAFGVAVKPATRISASAVQPGTGFANLAKTERHEAGHHVLAQLKVPKAKSEAVLALAKTGAKSPTNFRLLKHAATTVKTPTRETKARMSRARLLERRREMRRKS